MVSEGWTSPLPRVAAGYARSWGAMKLRWPELGSMLGAVRSLVLHCPQRSERSQLRLGQAPDARDIQSLVGAVAAQRAERLAALQVPERDGPVIPATGQRAPIGTHLERVHRPLMGFSHPYALPAVNIPPAQPAITASTDHQLSTRSPGQRRDHTRMPRQGATPCLPGRVALPAVCIPHHQLPTVPAAAARGQPGAIRAPG